MELRKKVLSLVMAVVLIASLAGKVFADVSGPLSPAREKAASTGAVNLAASIAVTQIVAAQSGKQIKVYGIIHAGSGSAASKINFAQGTGTNCATSQLDLTATLVTTTNTEVMMSSPLPIMTTSAGYALCVSNSTAVAGSVTIIYIQE